ncbi:MAG: LPS-assembly protein LptD [Treponema sp.]|nr:LPS-assembly protein LptD [Treponema sp.]
MKRFLAVNIIIFNALVLFPQNTGTDSAAELLQETTIDSEDELLQEDTEHAEQEDTKTVLNPAYVLERDIATSTQEELADWCLSLGLNNEGSMEALESRLREYYKLEKPGEETIETDADGTLVITIENARTTEYFTVESVHEDYVRLVGSVSITLKDGTILHRIQADQILYNRTRKLLTATGNVVYVKEDGDKLETFRGEGITVNLDNWSVAFMKGVSDHELSEGETRYRFAGEVISRSGEDSTVLRNAEVTNPDDEESLWSIRASKLWLLPGSDWAVLNAVIRVGEIPVLWLPAFYYPANEIIFHPVLGLRVREGTYVQTTTYILGRSRASSSSEESSITTIMGSGDDMVKKREGVFLRSTGVKRRDENETRLSFMADAYVNLGYYLGSELTIPSKEHFGDLSFEGGIGFSRNIALYMGNYTPFFQDYDNEDKWHKSSFFNYRGIPFRYRFISTGSANIPGTAVRIADITWNLPFYSDPYIDNDFMRRSESSDLFSNLKSATTPDFTISDNVLSSYSLQFNSHFSFSTAPLEPYINDLSISSAGMAVTFDTRTTTKDPPSSQLSHPPNYTFFFPDKFTLFSITSSIGGMPVILGNRRMGTGEESLVEGWPRTVPPWENSNDTEPIDNTGELVPPSISRTINARPLGGYLFTIDYKFAPAAASEIRFNSDLWRSKEDIDWSDIEYQLFSMRIDGNIGLTLSDKSDIYTHSLRFYGTTSWQDYLKEIDAVDKREIAERQMHNMRYLTSSAAYVFTVRPFLQNEMWQTSNLNYTLKGLLGSGSYVYDVITKDQTWTVNAGKWNREDLEIHRVQGNFNANVMDYMQSISIIADIPPEEGTLAADATARVWISETNANARVRSPFENPYYEPVYFTETLRFTDIVSLRHYMVYDPDKSDWTMMTTSLTWGGLSASLTASRSFGYNFVSIQDDPSNYGWIQNDIGAERFRRQNFTLDYTKTYTFNEGGKISFESSVNTGFTFDLQRSTNSKFFFTLSTGLRVNRFLDIVLNSHSENAAVYRYFPNAFFFSTKNIDVPGEKNFIIDLVNSFRFDDVNKRQASGFKLKSFGLDFIHHLGDWDATFGVTLTPELDRTSYPYQYRFLSQISFVVQWKPIKEFKTSTKYDSEEGFSFD